ncbi:MAG: type II toxin-antitoxin system PemK/MazF family toxin [Gaiellaceae bacterium]
MYDVEFPSGRRPGVIVTRDRAIPVLRNVTVVEVTGTIRNLPTEVLLGPAQGLARECVASCDNVHTVSKVALGRRRGALGPERTRHLDLALSTALGLD